MPDIDVSDVLLDSDIAGDPFVVIRRKEAVDNTGHSNVTLQQFQALGSVQPMDAELIRELDYDANTNGIVVTTGFKLRTASEGYKADIILWNGNNFVVRRIEAWQGSFVRAECVSEDFVDNPPR